jgi:DNA-binding PadR family transcriptional regulator
MTKTLGEFERFILFALLELDAKDAYGVPIREAIERRTGEEFSAGAIYTALDRMEESGMVSSVVGEPTAERGGRRKRLYRLEPAGLRALDRSVRVHESMSRGLLPRLKARLSKMRTT